MNHRRRYLIILLLITISFLMPQGNPVIISSNIGYGNVIFNSGILSFSQVIIDSQYIGYNHLRFYVSSTNPISITMNSVASSINDNIQFSFTATAAAGTAWFNITGLTPFVTYTVNRDSSSNIVCVSNASGGISFSESSWSSHTYTCSSGSVGSNLRSDGSHLFMTMEDGITPYYLFKNMDTEINIDSNSTLEGKYCLNVSKTGTIATDMDDCIQFNYPIRPTEYTVKFIPKIVPNNGYIRIALGFNPTTNDERLQLKFDNTTGTIGKITITDLLSHQHFTSMEPWQQNCIYKLTLSNIVYRTHSATQSHLFDATLSNATASQTITGLQMGTSVTIYGYNKPLTHLVAFAVDPTMMEPATVFLDDWTVGTQSNISTTALPLTYPVSSSSINETQATITGTINNDGSPLQNNSEFNNTVSVLYDTVPHNTTSYTYYFNETNMNGIQNITDIYDTTYVTMFPPTYDYYDTTENGGVVTYDTRPIGQSFTPSTSYILYSCQFLMYRLLNPGILTMTLQLTDALGKPTGIILSTGTTNGDSLIAAAPYEWRNIVFNDPFYIEAGTQYAIVLEAQNAAPNAISIRERTVDASYAGGTLLTSNDNGLTWATFVNDDLLFFTYTINMINLTNHSGNSTALNQNGNISKIEFRTKTNISSGSYNGEISLQPVWNNTNGTQYNIFSDTTPSWSDWIDVTQDVNYSHPDWNDTRELQCRVIANLSSGIAFVGMVELRVSINRTLDYAFNTSSIGVYHTGDTTSIPISGLTPGQVYFYRNKINTTYTNSSSYYYGDEQYFLTKPYAPTSTGATPINETCINISWTKGTGANTTVLVSKTTGYPSSPYDGTIVYNGTGTYFLLNVTKGTPSYTRAWSYDAWSVNPILWHFSDNYTEFNWSIVGFNVFNESRLPYLEAIGFDLEITNREGTFVYYAINCNNTHFVNITNIPTGTNIHIIIRNNTNYRFRDYYMDVFPATIYNESFYLPTLTTEEPGPEDDCSLRTSIDSISISSNATDATITLQHDLEEIISVELYNKSLYGTYGGWLFIASSNYTTTTNTVTINKSVLDINTTMIRVQYYYMYCVGTVIETPLYYLRVVETIETEYTEVDRGVPDAIVNIKRYVNDSGIYETVAGPITDANGYVNVYLIPNALYKVFINKTGYEEMIADYIPAPPNEWGQTTEKIFRIISLSTGIENVTIPPGFYDHIIFNGTMFTNGSIFVNYVDLSSETINAQFYTYMMYNYSRLLIDTQNTILLNSFQYWITGINASKQHMVTIFLNHTTLGAVTTSIFLGPVNNSLYHDPAIVEDAMDDVYGNFDLGYVRFFIEWLPFIGILIVLGRIEAGMGIFGGALYLALVGKFFGDLPAELWQILPIILLFAVLWYIATKGKFRL